MNHALAARAAAAALTVLLVAACSGDTPDPAGTPTTADPRTTAPPPAPTDWDGRVTGAPTTRDLSTYTEAYTPPPVPTGQEGQPRGLDLHPESVDVLDVDQVAEAFALTMLTPDTALDVTPADVHRRAARWAAQEYAATLTQPRPSSGGAQWVALAQDGGYVEAELDEHPAVRDGLITAPAEQDLTAERPYLAVLTPRQAGLPAEQTSVIVYLTRTGPGQPWQVWDYYQEGDYE